MRKYFLISFIIHTTLFVSTLLAFPASIRKQENIETIPIELIDISTLAEITNVKVPQEDDQFNDIPAQKATRGVAEGAIKIQKEQELTKTRKTEILEKKIEEENIIKKKKSKIKLAKLTKIPTKPVKKIKLLKEKEKSKRLTALIDRISKETALGKEKSPFNIDKIQKIVLSDTGNADISAPLTHVQIDLLKMQISRCWNTPIAIKEAEKQIVQVKIFLNSDGTLARQPVNIQKQNAKTSLIAIESALRAVIQCQPYNLPARNYRSWKEIKINFDPRDLLK